MYAMDPDLKKSIRECVSSDSPRILLKDTLLIELAPGEVEFVHRAIDKIGPASDFCVAYLGSHTMDALARYTRMYCAIQGEFVLSSVQLQDLDFRSGP